MGKFPRDTKFGLPQRKKHFRIQIRFSSQQLVSVILCFLLDLCNTLSNKILKNQKQINHENLPLVNIVHPTQLTMNDPAPSRSFTMKLAKRFKIIKIFSLRPVVDLDSSFMAQMRTIVCLEVPDDNYFYFRLLNHINSDNFILLERFQA